MTKHQEQVANRQLRTASLLMDLCDEAGVSRSPSEVRHLIAKVLGDSCSQATLQRIHLALEATAVGR